MSSVCGFSVDLDRPGTDLQRLRLARDRFVGAEFVEVVVARRIFLIGQRPVELVALVALGGVERGRGIGIRRPGQASADARCREDRPRRQTLQEAAAIAEDRLARRGALGQFPAAAYSDQHCYSSRWLVLDVGAARAPAKSRFC
jgi:hypothetical protein